MSTLYHYTCADHGQPGITRSGVVIPTGTRSSAARWHGSPPKPTPVSLAEIGLRETQT